MTDKKSYTVNILGELSKKDTYPYNSYYANGVTAIELKAKDKREARQIASQFGKVLYVFE